MRLEIVDLGLIFIVGPQDRYEELPESLNQKLQTAESDDIEGEIYVALGRAKYLLNELGTAIQLFNKGLMHLKSPKSTGRSLPTIGSVPIPSISFKSVKGLNRPKPVIRYIKKRSFMSKKKRLPNWETFLDYYRRHWVTWVYSGIPLSIINFDSELRLFLKST